MPPAPRSRLDANLPSPPSPKPLPFPSRWHNSLLLRHNHAMAHHVLQLHLTMYRIITPLADVHITTGGTELAEAAALPAVPLALVSVATREDGLAAPASAEQWWRGAVNSRVIRSW